MCDISNLFHCGSQIITPIHFNHQEKAATISTNQLTRYGGWSKAEHLTMMLSSITSIMVPSPFVS